MERDSKPKLVFTTDQNSKDFQKNEVPDLVDKSEIRQEIFNDVKVINQSRKKIIKEKHKMREKIQRSSDEIRSEFSKLVDFLFTGKKTRQDIIAHFNYKKVAKADNLMQRARAASENIIVSINGMWQVLPSYQSGKNALLDKMVQNRNALWKKCEASRKKPRTGLEGKYMGDKLILRMKPATMGPIDLEKPAHFEFDYYGAVIVIDINDKCFNLSMKKS